ncbi:hypothetical protein APICC_05397 [Apis cerana cerana]|uniref:Mos1 transposase HTH domain-containing protein n=1 Tax=Apis cerana cerana TaxID=94128 RepID=A0A2A3E1F2_APICC|nr:hypothetical protein APICC_05397 [Apis cerana cerana]
MQAYLLAIYSIGFGHPRALLKYVSLTQSLLKLFTTPYESQRKHLRYIMLYCFKKDDSANDIANEICTAYGSSVTTITIIRN